MFLAGENQYFANQDDFEKIPGGPVAYWAGEKILKAFGSGIPLETLAHPKKGLATTDNNRFCACNEIEFSKFGIACKDKVTAEKTNKKWFPLNKGGEYRRWYGNKDYVVNWEHDGAEMKAAVIKDITVALIAKKYEVRISILETL